MESVIKTVYSSWTFESKSGPSSDSTQRRAIEHKEVIRITSPLLIVSLPDLDLQLREIRRKRIVKRELLAMINPPLSYSQENLLRDAASMAIYFRRFGCLSSQKYVESLGETVCALDLKNILAAG